ncbi:hypothetical protein NN561_007705 [Cricetulus griseus]
MYLVSRPERKFKKEGKDKEKVSDEKPDDIEKIKSYTYMESEPEDDVYLKRLYPRRIYEVEKAIHLLKKFQVLDFTNPKQGVYLDLTLDMASGKKILDDEVVVDFYVAVPEIMTELNPLRKKLKKRFPKTTRSPFVVRAFLRSSTSEGLLLKTDSLLPKEVETKEAT